MNHLETRVAIRRALRAHETGPLHSSQQAVFDGTWAGLAGKPDVFPPEPHTHDLYAPLEHSHPYAAAVHDHNGVYAPLAHSHDYAATSHDHDGVYDIAGSAAAALVSALEADFDGAWGSLSGVPATFPPSPHDHDAAYAAIGHAHAGVYEPANANIQAHVAQAHAPANAQKNSDILKAEIEAVLTGVIGSHSHAGGGGSPFMFEGALAADAATGANVTPITLTGLVFTFEANSRYWVEIVGAVRAAAATTGSGFQLDVSAAVTRVGMTFDHQLANTGTRTGGSSIADDASVGVSSGRPSANVDTPIMGAGYLITGANTGTAQLRYRSEVAAVSTVMAGFMMRVRKVT